MELGAILAGLALFVLSAAFVFSPFQRVHAEAGQKDSARAGDAAQHKREILGALRDLDFDYQTGKVATEDYMPLRDQLIAQAALLAETLEKEEARIEALIRGRRQTLTDGALVQQKQGLAGEHDRFCPFCGARTVPGGLYCSRCGEYLAREVEPGPQKTS